MKHCLLIIRLCVLVIISYSSQAQSCPATALSTISSNPNTYYPGLDTSIVAGAKSITLGAASAGTTQITSGDLLLIIQMQGAQLNSTNTTAYGAGNSSGTANGYLNNSVLMAGNMEYIVATNTVPLSGGTLSILKGTINKYKNAAFGTDGQYRFQVIRVGLYYNLMLAGTITASPWNGTSGGVVVLSVTNNLNFNAQTITAAAEGFRGGGARQLTGGTGGLSTDVVTLSTKNYNGSKGEGIAGTPRFINNNGVLIDNGATNEGYPNGSYAAGAPANAGGGGTDGQPSVNDQNSGGGGGANGGLGGRGGNSWSTNLAVGGEPGAVFAQNNPSRLVMGGGGGAGTTNNGTGSLSAGLSSSGATGGGIVLLTAYSITGTGTIDVSGQSAFITVLNDGSGGGGAGGSALIYAGSGLYNITVTAKGGTGGTNTGTGQPHGPGGGGGGGIIYSNGTLNAASSTAAGTAGYTALGTTHYGSTDGAYGIIIQTTTQSQVPNQFLYCSLLPIYFENISAAWQQNNVDVKWAVGNENPSLNYTVEKSTDGASFTAAGETSLHSFTDTKNDGKALTYYRIKSSEAGSNIIYSNLASVNVRENLTTGRLTASPNPSAGETVTIRFDLVNAARITLKIFSVNGVPVWQKQFIASAGNNSISVENISSIPQGTYFIQYYNGSKVQTIKLVVNH